MADQPYSYERFRHDIEKLFTVLMVNAEHELGSDPRVRRRMIALLNTLADCIGRYYEKKMAHVNEGMAKMEVEEYDVLANLQVCKHSIMDVACIYNEKARDQCFEIIKTIMEDVIEYVASFFQYACDL